MTMENGCTDSFHEAKKSYSRCALATLSVVLLMQGCGLLVSLSLDLTGMEISSSMATLLTQLPLPLILFAAYALLRPGKETAIPRTELHPGDFLTLLPAALPIVYGGNLLGTLLASVLTMGTAFNRLALLSAQMDIPLALYVVFLGPLAEELFFRGALLPRMSRYGQKTALLFSALFFALYHVNVYQWFYAFGLGLLLGAVYLKTGSIRAGYILHAAINLLGGVLPALISSDRALVSFALIMLALSGFGIIPLLRFKREMTFEPAPLELPSDIGKRAASRNTSFVLLLVVTLALALLDLYT